MNPIWAEKGSLSILPPEDYWKHLARTHPNGNQIKSLREQSELGLNEIAPFSLGGSETLAIALLEQVASDGWLKKETRYKCPQCDESLDAAVADSSNCPVCDGSFSQYGGITIHHAFTRRLPAPRQVDWVITIHGMNTRGAWQETFTWRVGTTWGRSVPVAVYKYGWIIAGVLMTWRRRHLQRRFREKLATLQAEARANGYMGKPDVIAHSFGTWLLGHLIRDELKQQSSDRLYFGRIILTGCVLRPDFDWEPIKSAGIVEEVLNHYGTRDGIVPLAHATISDSGPSGRIGFDGNDIINVPATDYGHSDFFEIDKYVINGVITKSTSTNESSLLVNCYENVWRPFLTLPASEIHQFPNRTIRPSKWKPLIWALRGTIFPWIIFPLIGSLLLLLLIGFGALVSWFHLQPIAVYLAKFAGSGVAILLVAIAIVFVGRWLFRKD